MTYEPLIGLEIHVELKTKTKMFCDCLNDPDERHPNLNICPVCTAQPGALPVINKNAVEAVLKVGMALKGEIPQFSKFDRKNYFYPDLPKAYQISQYDLPLIVGGVLNGIRLRRIHLEEDTARMIHEKDASGNEASLVDFNRAGLPLMELVTEPDVKNAKMAGEFARELQLILQYLGVSDADMEKGEMRVEANISVGKEKEWGTKVEVKNLNSFKAVEDAIDYEIKRQTELLKEGKKIVQETRGWDENKKATFSQRIKEEAYDYRYFPEPDLPPLDLSKFELTRLKTEIPELPKEKRLRLIKEYNLSADQADMMAKNRDWAKYFEEMVSEIGAEEPANMKEKIQLGFNYLTSDLRGLMIERDAAIGDIKIKPEDFAELINMIFDKKVSSRGAKDILPKMLETGVDPNDILAQENLTQISDESSLKSIAQKIIKENPKAIEDYKKGKSNALQFLIGKAMAELKGRGNPEMLRVVFEILLKT